MPKYLFIGDVCRPGTVEVEAESEEKALELIAMGDALVRVTNEDGHANLMRFMASDLLEVDGERADDQAPPLEEKDAQCIDPKCPQYPSYHDHAPLTDSEYRELARKHVVDGDLELDDDATVSRADGNSDGAYVQMWKWIDAPPPGEKGGPHDAATATGMYDPEG